MSEFVARDKEFESRVRKSFELQTLMSTIGARMTKVFPGEVEIELPYRRDLCQQNGYLHAGIATAIVDTACGYAALSLMPAGFGVLTVEYKANFVAPAIGDLFIARAVVKKAGRTLSVCSGDVVAVKKDEEKLVATMLTTMMALRNS
ncbi:MAG: thioesterase [Blastocatellia bacterium AA13]|nr:MAG: thioesterase [Blastocatellia bacterium AA13]